MDDLVKQAMAKWPNVPHCYGWLGLDNRGHWWMRDERAQRAGDFDSGLPGCKGAQLQHEKLIAFIERNYDCDARGQWFFQNGPQRVYVELQATPWVWRVMADGRVHSHTGREAGRVKCLWLDEQDWCYLETELGLGLVHSLDTVALEQALETHDWPQAPLTRSALAERFGFVRSPERALRESK